MTNKYVVAAITCEPILKHKEENIKEQYALVEEAAQKGAKLIVLPEMATTGYCWYDREEIAPFTENVPGPTTDLFEKISRKYDCYIVVGLPEVEEKTGIFYNTAALIGPNGFVGKHRKTHHFVSDDRWAKSGDLGHQVFDTSIGKIGILICMDINFMETGRIEALEGADVIVCSAAWVGDKTPALSWYTRAYENGCYVIASDRDGLERGSEFNGGSCIIDPNGNLLSYADKANSIAYGEIIIDNARDKSFSGVGHKINERRPELYKNIILDKYLWDPINSHGLYDHDPLPKGKKSVIAVSQFSPIKGEKNKNRQLIHDEVKKHSLSNAQLIVFPELSTVGIVDKKMAYEVAENIPGETINWALDLCLKYQVHLVIGMVEKDGDDLYNTAVLVSPAGIIGKYRKTHLSQAEKEWASQGNIGINYFDTQIGRIGILIGHDLSFPETARVHSINGADIICCPAALSEPIPQAMCETQTWHRELEPCGYTNIWWHLARVRAGENNCYIAFANYVGEIIEGKKAIGRSGIFSPMLWKFPREEVILSGDAADSATMEICTETGLLNDVTTGNTRKKYLLNMRKPVWYDRIVY